MVETYLEKLESIEKELAALWRLRPKNMNQQTYTRFISVCAGTFPVIRKKLENLGNPLNRSLLANTLLRIDSIIEATDHCPDVKGLSSLVLEINLQAFLKEINKVVPVLGANIRRLKELRSQQTIYRS